MKSTQSLAERRQLRVPDLQPFLKVSIEVEVCLTRRFSPLPNDEPSVPEPDWVEAWHPSRQIPLSLVLRAVRHHQSAFGGQIDVGFLPNCGACHVFGRRSHVLRAVGAVCEAAGLTMESWQFAHSTSC